MAGTIIIYLACILQLLYPLIKHTLGADVQCVGKSQCYCEYTDGSGIVNITSLGRTDNKPQFQDVNTKTGYKYSYNPCYSFEEGSCNEDVAVCQLFGSDQQITTGNQGQFEFKTDGTKLEIVYKNIDGGATRYSYVQLVCDESHEDFVAIGEKEMLSYYFTLTSKCACKNGCLGPSPTAGPTADPGGQPGGLSIGSIMVIIFFVLIIVYAVAGTIFMKYRRKAQGREIIPNLTFWGALPALIKGGFLFTFSLCKRGQYGKI